MEKHPGKAGKLWNQVSVLKEWDGNVGWDKSGVGGTCYAAAVRNPEERCRDLARTWEMWRRQNLEDLGAAWMWGLSERGGQNDPPGFWLRNWVDVETGSWDGGPSRGAGCGAGSEVGEFSCEQAGAEHPAGHPRAENARHHTGTRESGDLQENISAVGNSPVHCGGSKRESCQLQRDWGIAEQRYGAPPACPPAPWTAVSTADSSCWVYLPAFAHTAFFLEGATSYLPLSPGSARSPSHFHNIL